MREADKLVLREICAKQDAEAVARFLAQSTWPFHARATLTLEEARQVKLGPPSDVRAWRIQKGGSVFGMVRVMDLADAHSGSVTFDLRIAAEWRGRGYGQNAVRKLVSLLFAEYPSLHRIEGATRFDNRAMRRVLEANSFVLEGRLRETWRSDDGTRHDTALYGRLRSDS